MPGCFLCCFSAQSAGTHRNPAFRIISLFDLHLFASSLSPESTTFMPPHTYNPVPVDGALSVLQVFEFQAKKNPQHPLFRYDSPSARDGYEDIAWPAAVRMFETTANVLRRRLAPAGLVEDEDRKRPVVGILAATGSILYASLIFGAVRAGLTAFPISTRNSDVAIAHLISQSGVRWLLVSPDAHMQELARKANALLQERGVSVEMHPIPTYEEISDMQGDLNADALPELGRIGDDEVLVIAHSSGSTSFPKVVPLTHRYMKTIRGTRPMDFSGWVQSSAGSAIFHAMGILSIVRAAYSGTILAFFPPTTSAVLATPERLLQSALATKCSTILCPPMFLEHYAKDPSSIEKLRTFSRVSFGGGALAQQVGDILEASGVALVPAYGSTETGSIAMMFTRMSFLTDKRHKEGWQYFEFVPGMDAILVSIDGDASKSLFQLIIKQSPMHALALPNMEIDGVPACDTRDIVQRHPMNPGLYRLYGRVDDQIMHSNGEKTNPGPIEQILAQNSLVKSAIMFGRARPHAGVLIVPAEEVRDREAFREAIWPTVEEANKFAPAHSRLFKEMIILFTPSKTFHLTSKGTPRRHAIIEDHTQEIEDAYVAFDETAGAGEMKLADAVEIVRFHVHTHINSGVADDGDVFEAGADSLLAARVRRGIMQSLSEPHLSVPEIAIQSLPNDVVFTFPTIGKLASFVYGVVFCAASLPQAGTPFMKNVPVSILDRKDDTIVRLSEPEKGEPPLILVHGGTGLIYAFAYMQTHFNSGLWAIQVTDETPRNSFVEQTDFYYRKIKEAQPTGPYRMSGYSAGAFMACRITKLLEANGDKVIQLALIDGSPFGPLTPRVGLDTSADFNDPQSLHAHYERSVRGVCRVFRAYNDAWWTKFAAAIWERWNGRLRLEDMTELMAWMYENLIGGTLRTFDYMLSQAEAAEEGRKGYGEVLAGMVKWTGEIRAPVTVYRAANGIIKNVPLEEKEKWGAFGVDWAKEEVRIVEVDANHSNILAQDDFVKDIQKFAH
ncbi:Acetyl-CoA synthetase-like protein [Mycena sanguinolenta]|uniref:Acetyl-CoA synthetase-like protein n=1 Tax=Mycena sanguinolenta TaxID=230812 RepID=A0A8H6Y3W1_9AGAR|nr:Acetyl-CoA synthetase-like protein [Mycena sanguinolenta]